MNTEHETRNIEGKQIARRFDLEERFVAFAVRVLAVVEALPATIAGQTVAKQLVRSGTAPAANYAEAQSAESRRDFVHKLKIALKELRETRVWLLIIQRKPLIEPADKLTALVGEANELIAILAVSIKTARNNDAQS